MACRAFFSPVTAVTVSSLTSHSFLLEVSKDLSLVSFSHIGISKEYKQFIALDILVCPGNNTSADRTLPSWPGTKSSIFPSFQAALGNLSSFTSTTYPILGSLCDPLELL